MRGGFRHQAEYSAGSFLNQELGKTRNFLFDRINYEKSMPNRMSSQEFRFHTIGRMLFELGDPHLNLPTIHVAGTKGKGSVSTTIASILSSAGMKVGLYTSPHLFSIEERFVVDGRKITSKEFASTLLQIIPVVEGIDKASASCPELHAPTFFEITTVLAFLFFARQNVDAAVIEVGLGGRLDSTNICKSTVSVITNIDLDHTAILGDTIAQIAYEKAGIIKPGTPVINGAIGGDAKKVISEIADQRQARIFHLRDDFEVVEYAKQPDELRPTFSTRGRLVEDCPSDDLTNSDRPADALHRPPGSRNIDNVFKRQSVQDSRGHEWEYEYQELRSGLAGRHQTINAGLAIAASHVFANCVGKSELLSQHAVSTGVAKAKLKGRFQTLSIPVRSPDGAQHVSSVFDMAHNPASIKTLLETLSAHQPYKHSRDRVLVFATSRDKDFEQMLRQLIPAFDHIVLTKFTENPRAIGPETLIQYARNLHGEARMFSFPTPGESIKWITEHVTTSGFACFTGSTFLVAEALACIERNGTSLLNRTK